MSFIDSNKEMDGILANQEEDAKRKSQEFIEGVKQEIHQEFNELVDWRLLYTSYLNKDWDNLQANKIVREIISNLDICIAEHRKHCPVCDPTRWGSQNSFKEDLCT